MSSRKTQIIVFTLLILTTGLILRTYQLGTHDLWFDEAMSIYMAKNLSETPFDSQPPLYYFLLNFWIKLLVINEWKLRFLSLISGILSILMIYQAGKLLSGYRTALAGAFILSISPLHIWYAQEVKGYTFSSFLTIATFYFFISTLKHDKKYHWIGFIIFSVFSIYTNYVCLFMFVPELLVILVYKDYRHLFKKWLASLIIIITSFVPWVIVFLIQTARLKHHFWIPVPNWKSLLITIENFNLGYTGTNTIYTLSLILFLSLSIWGVFYAWRRKESIIAVSLLSFFLIPIILTFILSKWLPIYIDRQLLCFSVFYYLLIAAGITGIKNCIIKGGVFSLIILLSLPSLANYYSGNLPSGNPHHLGTYLKKPFKPIVKYIKENIHNDDIIVHSNPSTIAPFWYYYDNMNPDKQYHLAINLSAEETRGDPYWKEVAKVIVNFNGKKQPMQHIIDIGQNNNLLTDGNFREVWFISSSWARNGRLDKDSLILKEWMNKHFVKLDSREFDGIVVERYKH